MTKSALVMASVLAAIAVCTLITIAQVIAQDTFAGTRAVVEFQRAAALAAEHRASRPELFTPRVVPVFRQIAARASRAPGCEDGALKSGAWEIVQINAPATGTKSISRCIASALPVLPGELEYRSAGTVLVVVDVNANQVVDVLPALLGGNELR